MIYRIFLLSILLASLVNSQEGPALSSNNDSTRTINPHATGKPSKYSIGYGSGFEFYKIYSEATCFGIRIGGDINSNNDSARTNNGNGLGYEISKYQNTSFDFGLLWKRRFTSNSYFALDGVLEPGAGYSKSTWTQRLKYDDSVSVLEETNNNTAYSIFLSIRLEPCFKPTNRVELFWSANAGIYYRWAEGIRNNKLSRNESYARAYFPNPTSLTNSIGIRYKL